MPANTVSKLMTPAHAQKELASFQLLQRIPKSDLDSFAITPIELCPINQRNYEANQTSITSSCPLFKSGEYFHGLNYTGLSQIQYPNGGNDLSKINLRVLASPMVNAFMRSLQTILYGLVLLHKNDIFHRDLKPDNILTQYDPTINVYHTRMIDFGLSKSIDTYIANPLASTANNFLWPLELKLITADILKSNTSHLSVLLDNYMTLGEPGYIDFIDDKMKHAAHLPHLDPRKYRDLGVKLKKIYDPTILGQERDEYSRTGVVMPRLREFIGGILKATDVYNMGLILMFLLNQFSNPIIVNFLKKATHIDYDERYSAEELYYYFCHDILPLFSNQVACPNKPPHKVITPLPIANAPRPRPVESVNLFALYTNPMLPLDGLSPREKQLVIQARAGSAVRPITQKRTWKEWLSKKFTRSKKRGGSRRTRRLR